jgi:cytochrome c oxidase assembly factor CtaG
VAADDRGTVSLRPHRRGRLDAVTTDAPPETVRRRVPDLVWIAWLVAAAVLVLLAVSVVRHLATGGQHVHPSTALFRAGQPRTLGPLLGHRLVTEWQLDAVALAVLCVALAWYVTGIVRLRRRTGQSWPWLRTISFVAGLAICAYATCGAIAVYDQALFTAHMAGHLALVMAAPALIVVGGPLRLAVSAARPATAARIERVSRGSVVSLLTAPPVALACYAAVIVGSHLTGLMDAIMQHTWAGQVEHLVYLLVGYQLFVLVVGDEPIRWRLSTPVRWVLLAVAMAVDTFTGVTLMLASAPVAMTAVPGLSVNPLDDTHAGGAIMWFWGDALMAVVMIGLVIGWLRTSGQSARDRSSWLEQAREATLHERTAGHSGGELDEDESRLIAYNEWLASIARADRER